jgi:hypothetical protein
MTAVKATALVVLAAAEETLSRAIMAKLQYDANYCLPHDDVLHKGLHQGLRNTQCQAALPMALRAALQGSCRAARFYCPALLPI